MKPSSPLTSPRLRRHVVPVMADRSPSSTTNESPGWGRVLRRFSIDELPNLWNVIEGSMTLVGPRPLVRDEAELVGLSHPRFSVKPGITGLAQVEGRYINFDERDQLDANYVEDRSMGLDLRILWRTFGAVFTKSD